MFLPKAKAATPRDPAQKPRGGEERGFDGFIGDLHGKKGGGGG